MLPRPILIITVIATSIIIGGTTFLIAQKIIENSTSGEKTFLNPLAAADPIRETDAESEPETELEATPTAQPEPTSPEEINSSTATKPDANRPRITTTKARSILFLGSDRRSTNEVGRTDTIMLISIIQDERKILLTSIPRDLWIDGQKINAVLANNGFATLRDKIVKITGLDAPNYIVVDFDGAVWAVDQLERVPINISRSFTDYNYPADRNGVTVPLHFDSGEQNLDGETALAYCRSRKGDSGEGDDFQRMRRQQNLIQALPNAFRQSPLAEFAVDALFELVRGHIQTNLNLDNLATLLPIIIDYPNYTTKPIVLDTTNFLYHPPMANYGGAYVLRPQGESFTAIQDRIASELN